MLVRLSVEGSSLSRDKDNKNIITESICRKVSATLSPCNRSCDVDVIVDPNAPEGWNKTPAKDSKETEDLLASLMDKKEGQHPNYTRLGGSVETAYVPFDKSEADVLAKFKLIAKSKILKANIWLSNIADFALMNEAWDAWVPAGHTPARATVESRLASSNLLVEIMVEAAV